MIENPHFAIPFRFLSGHAVENEQDSIDDIAACVEAILRTEPGSRLDAPEFGTPDQTFSTGVNVQEVERDIRRWEPRAELAIEEGWDFATFTEQLRIELSAEGGSLG